VFIDEILRGGHGGEPAERMAAAMDRTIARVTEIVSDHGGAEPSYLNCAVSDGDNAVVSRFTNDDQHPPETLYYFTGDLYPRAEFEETKEPGTDQRSVIISSERLTPDPGWESIPPNYMVVLRRNSKPALVQCAEASGVVN
jgi:predicted glutamine amidotransferase